MQVTSVQSGALQCQMRPRAASCRPLITANLSLLLQGHNISKSNSPSVYCLGDLSGWFREWDTCRPCGR